MVMVMSFFLFFLFSCCIIFLYGFYFVGSLLKDFTGIITIYINISIVWQMN